MLKPNLFVQTLVNIQSSYTDCVSNGQNQPSLCFLSFLCEENTRFEAENMTRVPAHNNTMQHKEITSFQIVVLCIFFATFVVGLIGNGLVIFLTGCRMKTTINSIWFLNLAIADFIFLLSSIIAILLLSQWHSHLMTYIFLMTVNLNQFASIFFSSSY